MYVPLTFCSAISYKCGTFIQTPLDYFPRWQGYFQAASFQGLFPHYIIQDCGHVKFPTLGMCCVIKIPTLGTDLKFCCLFSCGLSCSLSRCSSLIWFSTRKTQVAKCNAVLRFPAKENFPNTPVPIRCPASPPPPWQSVWTGVVDVITKFLAWIDFPKNLSHGALLAHASRAWAPLLKL